MISVPSTVPPHYSTTMPLFQSVPPHFTVTIPLFHHILLSLWLFATVSLFHHTLLLRDTVTLFHCCATLYCHRDSVLLFRHSLLSLWHRLCHCTTVVPLFTITATLCHSVPPHFTITMSLFHHVLPSLWLGATWQGVVIGLSPILGRPLLIFHCPDALACAVDVIKPTMRKRHACLDEFCDITTWT